MRGLAPSLGTLSRQLAHEQPSPSPSPFEGEVTRMRSRTFHPLDPAELTTGLTVLDFHVLDDLACRRGSSEIIVRVSQYDSA